MPSTRPDSASPAPTAMPDPRRPPRDAEIPFGLELTALTSHRCPSKGQVVKWCSLVQNGVI